MTGSCLICSRCIEALLNAKLLELLESSLFFVCEMAKVTLESGLGFGGFGRGWALLVFRDVVTHVWKVERSTSASAHGRKAGISVLLRRAAESGAGSQHYLTGTKV